MTAKGQPRGEGTVTKIRKMQAFLEECKVRAMKSQNGTIGIGPQVFATLQINLDEIADIILRKTAAEPGAEPVAKGKPGRKPKVA